MSLTLSTALHALECNAQARSPWSSILAACRLASLACLLVCAGTLGRVSRVHRQRVHDCPLRSANAGRRRVPIAPFDRHPLSSRRSHDDWPLRLCSSYSFTVGVRLRSRVLNCVPRVSIAATATIASPWHSVSSHRLRSRYLILDPPFSISPISIRPHPHFHLRSTRPNREKSSKGTANR